MSTLTTKVAIYYPRAMHGDGGATNSLWLWAESLVRAGVEVEVLYDPRLPRSPTRSVPDGVRTRSVPHSGRGRFTRPRGLGRELDPSSLLILHSGYVLFNLIAGRVARSWKIPYVIMPQGAYNLQVRQKRRAIRLVWEVAERRLLERAEAVHVALPPEVDRVRQLAPAARTVTAATAFELPDAEWAPGDGVQYVAWLGRYDIQHKGLDRLLDAMALLPTQQRPLLKLHGRDHHESRQVIQAMVAERGLTENVTVGPPVDGAEKRCFLLNAAAYVHPSRWESFPVAMLESLAYGVPCLTTSDIDLGGELARSEAALVVPGTPAGLAEGLQLAATGLLARYGGLGRAFVRDRLKHDVAGNEFLSQLHELSRKVIP